MRCASFNVLADAYTGYGDYSHVNPALLQPNGRTEDLVRLINGLDADVIGLQEVEVPLLQALDETGNWQTFWSQKERDKPDGCLTLVRPTIEVADFDTHPYSDGSGHIMQSLRIGETVFANTHIRWAPASDPEHVGVNQTIELLDQLRAEEQVVAFADCNDKPYGPVRRLMEAAGFTNVNDEEPSAIVNGELVALDFVAVRGMTATRCRRDYDLRSVPSRACPSDHIPVIVDLKLN